ncbi:regucalcin-like [Contarinia nasturtii]|uniref:regucalcin-like n=1 Tax=Contarinia nasturtii TaxID=265458 RepID=UPI0012D42D6D|nr:regucalcin-like [Contarinia nasturtii]
MCSVSYSGAGGHVDVDYDTVPLPSASLPIGIMDSPYYDCTAQSLYWVDLFGGSIFRYSEEINQIFYAQIPGYPGISFILPARNEPNTFVIGVENALYKIMWDGMNTTASVIGKITSAEDGTNHHTNAAVAGPKGAIYWGNFGPKLCGEDQNKGSFRWSRKGGKEQMPGMHKTSNSLTYDYKRGIFYHMDGCTQEITATDICRRTGKYSPFRMVFNQFCLPQYAAPVGISVGSDGSLWVGSYLNGTLFNIDPDKGKIINTYTMPTRLMGASTFGGCNYDKLYVLTSQLEVDVTNGNVISDGKTNPPPDPAGSLMIIHGLGKGRPLRKPCIGC